MLLLIDPGEVREVAGTYGAKSFFSPSPSFLLLSSFHDSSYASLVISFLTNGSIFFSDMKPQTASNNKKLKLSLEKPIIIERGNLLALSIHLDLSKGSLATMMYPTKPKGLGGVLERSGRIEKKKGFLI